MQKNTNSMVIRWDIALQELDYTVEFIKGTDNEMADSMSRLCLNRIEEPIQLMAAIELLADVSGDQLEALHMCHNSTVGHGGVDRTIQYLQRRSTNILLRESDAAFLTIAQKHFPLMVTLPNGSSITSLLSGTFKLPNLPFAIPAHVFADNILDTSLISVSELCNLGCVATVQDVL